MCFLLCFTSYPMTTIQPTAHQVACKWQKQHERNHLGGVRDQTRGNVLAQQ
jgi:hypothetical protein